MATGIYSWSQTAANNDDADSTINWSEGQAPSTVNNSARAVMAVLSKWRDDISGVQPSNVVQTSGGSANTQTLTSNGSIAALTNGWTVTWKAGYANTGAATLNVDGTGAKAIERISGSDLGGGELIAGCVYTTTYHQPSDSWVLHSAAINPTEVLLDSGSVSSSANKSFVLTAYTGYRAIKFIWTEIIVNTDNVYFACRTSTDGGSSYDSGASDYYQSGVEQTAGNALAAFDSSSGDSVVYVTNVIGNASGEGGQATVTLYDQTSTAMYKAIEYRGFAIDGSKDASTVWGHGHRFATADIDAIQFLVLSGTYSANYAMYGLL